MNDKLICIMHKMMIIVIRRNIDKVSGFPDIILGDICYKPCFKIYRLQADRKTEGKASFTYKCEVKTKPAVFPIPSSLLNFIPLFLNLRKVKMCSGPLKQLLY